MKVTYIPKKVNLCGHIAKQNLKLAYVARNIYFFSKKQLMLENNTAVEIILNPKLNLFLNLPYAYVFTQTLTIVHAFVL